MHAGYTSLTRKKYNHGDIHLKNILINKNNYLYLIDFYNSNQVIDPGYDFQKDKEETLYSICHDRQESSFFSSYPTPILTQEEFKSLPQILKDRLNPDYYKDLRNNNLLTFLASLLLAYQEGYDLSKIIEQLENDRSLQQDFIKRHYKRHSLVVELERLIESDEKRGIYNFFSDVIYKNIFSKETRKNTALWLKKILYLSPDKLILEDFLKHKHNLSKQPLDNIFKESGLKDIFNIMENTDRKIVSKLS